MALQGAGTELDPYLVTSLTELRTLVTNASAYYKITQDLDVYGTEYEAKWTECTIACLQLDFDNKKLKNLICAQGQHIFRFNCTTSIIKNAKFVNITNSRALFAHITADYTAITSLSILNCSMSIEWYANNTSTILTTVEFGLLGTPNTIIDKCRFELKIYGLTQYIVRSNISINRCNFEINGNFSLVQKLNASPHGRPYILFYFKHLSTKNYITGDATITCNSSADNFYIIYSPHNTTDYSQYAGLPPHPQCYFAPKLTINVADGTNHLLDFWKYPTSGSDAPPCSLLMTSDITVNGGILTSNSNTKGKVYVITKEQLRSVTYLDNLGFGVDKKE